VSSLDAVCAMVAAGVGAGIVPEATARRQRRGLPLALVRLAEPWANRELMLCVRDSRRLSRPAKKLFDALRGFAGARTSRSAHDLPDRELPARS
jgi:DNA-binding transcriptional LysR family regulator